MNADIRDDLLSIAADCREAARWWKRRDLAVPMAEAVQDRLIAAGLPIALARPRESRVMERLSNNIAAGCRLAASCPGMLLGYLLGAADELESLAGAPIEGEEACPPT